MTLNQKKVEDRIWTDMLDLCLTSSAQVLLDKMGFSARKAMTVLMNVSETASSIREDYVSMNDIKEMLEEEYGFVIRKNTKGVMLEIKKKGNNDDERNN